MIFGENFSLLPLQIGKQIYKIYVMDIAMLAIFLFWFLQIEVRKIKTTFKFRDKKDIWLAGFIFILFVILLRSIFLSANMSLAIGTFKNYLYVLVYFLALNMFSSWKEVFRILRVLFFGGIGILGFIFWGFIAGKGLWSEGTPGLRYLSGLHTYYVTFSLIIIFVLTSRRDYLYGKFFTSIIFLAQLAGLIGSMFRHLWLGFFCAISTIWFFMKKDERKNTLQDIWKVLFLGVFIAIFFLWLNLLSGNKIDLLSNTFLSSLVDRVGTLSQTGYEMESAAGWRLSAWKAVAHEYISAPIFGLGFGQVIYLDYNDFLDLIDVRNIHNDILSILFQVGLIGFIPFVMFHFYLIKDLLTALKENTTNRQILLIVSGFVIVAGFGAFFALYISFTGTAIFYWMVMAVASIIAKLKYTK
jgi:O-antigen ligase